MNNRAKIIGDIDGVLRELYNRILTPDEVGALLHAAKTQIQTLGTERDEFEESFRHEADDAATLGALLKAAQEELEHLRALTTEREAKVLRDSNLFSEAIGLVQHLYKMLPRKESPELTKADQKYTDFISKIRGV